MAARLKGLGELGGLGGLSGIEGKDLKMGEFIGSLDMGTTCVPFHLQEWKNKSSWIHSGQHGSSSLMNKPKSSRNIKLSSTRFCPMQDGMNKILKS